MTQAYPMDNAHILQINDQVYNLNDHTPMMVQYLQTKAKYPKALLLYRMGDFYELFFEDAKLASQLLDITLTRRGNDKAGNNIPMAGVPFHAADSYMARMIAKGQTVVICEQIEDKQTTDKSTVKTSKTQSSNKGIMKREVVRTLTAGTVTEEALITHTDASHTPCVVAIEFNIPKQPPSHRQTKACYQAGISRLDISAGQITCQQLSCQSLDALKNELTTVLARFAPSECLVNETLLHTMGDTHSETGLATSSTNLYLWLEQALACPMIEVSASDFSTVHAPQTLCHQFAVRHLDGLGIQDSPLIQATSAALIHYARQTQQRQIPHVNQLIVENSHDYLVLDDICQRNLEIFNSVSPNGTSLIQVLNHCQTPMGKRLLPEQLKRPLRNQQGSRDKIMLRADAVEHFVTHHQQLDNLRDMLINIADIERISSRISLASVKPRDLKKLAESIQVAHNLTQVLLTCQVQPTDKGLLPLLLSQLPPYTPQLIEVAELIERAIVDEPPAHIREGGMIKTGFDSELDRLIHLHDNVQDTLDSMLAEHQATYQLTNLKVGFNKVSGFYFELPKAQAQSAPDIFIRRQTLKSCERYVTDALKEVETDYLNAQSQALVREKQIYAELLTDLSSQVSQLQQLSQAVAQIDVLVNWAKLAIDYQWTRPNLTDSNTDRQLSENNYQNNHGNQLDIRQGRHVVVEAGLLNQHSSSHFVANDCVLGSSRLLLITGPNMGGKSTYMRQVALIVLLASCGSFVPAESATIGDIDRIFTRIGSADDLAGGKSTFMVEMLETAHILNLATDKSLVLMDEVGRGTSTTDGLAVAYACVKRLAQMQCLTLFATHYFELTALAEHTPCIENVHVVATEVDGKLLLLHQIRSGSANSSFGLHVAKMAGIPSEVIAQAEEYLTHATNKPTQHTQALSNQAYNSQLPNYQTTSKQPPSKQQTDLFEQLPQPLSDKQQQIHSLIEQLNPDNMTPRAALDWLYMIKNVMEDEL